MSQKDDLIRIVGSENVFDDPKTLEDYSKDESFVHPIKPRYVVKPKNADEVQGVVKWANESLTPLVPVSSGPPRFRGDTVPSDGGSVVVDLTNMKGIVRVDRPNRVAMIEPGVTFTELIPTLQKEGLGAYLPLVPRRTKSVIGSMLEREPITMPRHHWDAQDPLLCIEVIFGSGDMFRTGSAAGMGTIEEQWKVGKAQLRPMGPSQADLQRVVQGSQGTMGIVTWATMKCRLLPQIKKVFLVPCNKLEPLIDLSYRLLRIPIGDECLILNNHNLASIMAKGDDIVRLREVLPLWILFFSIEGYGILPEDKVSYQEGDFRAIAQQVGVDALNMIAGLRAEDVAEVLSKPSEEPYWKLRFKGGGHDIFFLTTLDRVPDFVKAMRDLVESWRYPPGDLGIYIQPTVQGCNCHCEFNLSYDPNCVKETEKVKGLVNGSIMGLANMGGFFSRPYGTWADVAYRRDAETTAALRKVKGIFDPNNIMNPGKLCF